MRVLLLLLAIACSEDTIELDDPNADDPNADTGGKQDSMVETFACGNTTCGEDELCYVPCCGGIPPPCVERTDAGDCPAGAQSGPCSSPNGPWYGCSYACQPPPPYCAPVSPSCKAAPSCGCAGNCTQGMCVFIEDRTVTCMCG